MTILGTFFKNSVQGFWVICVKDIRSVDKYETLEWRVVDEQQIRMICDCWGNYALVFLKEKQLHVMVK